MNKIERVTSALNNEEVDRLPFSFWYHFGLQHTDPEKHAETEVEFYRAYDLDFLKVMNDFPYPLPEGLSSLQTEDDWNRLEVHESGDPCWSKPLAVVSLINTQIGAEALFIDTIFSPWTVARRLAGSNGLTHALERFAETVQSAMERIAQSLANYASESISRGSSGIFYSLGAASEDVMSAEAYETWGRPFDLKVLAGAMSGRFNVLHIHGGRIHFEQAANYPAHAFNWSHHATPPDLARGREICGRAVMGGINEAVITRLSPQEVTNQIRQTVDECGTKGLIIGPGCSVPTDTPVLHLRSVKITLDALARR
ncbi:MAG: hypothetical protein DMF61_13135 [Blastocatellia bacterium AA13]|nr:MAG: hypothetical protein DMF61_13135 [Blastocatellia bacterium AA13]